MMMKQTSDVFRNNFGGKEKRFAEDSDLGRWIRLLLGQTLINVVTEQKQKVLREDIGRNIWYQTNSKIRTTAIP